MPASVLLGVCGWPVGHSRSPAIHNAALAATGLASWHYVRLSVPPDRFARAVGNLAGAGYRGINVTIPHKQAALALAGEASAPARAIGAANTLSFAPDGRIRADNTDAPGLLAALPADFAPAGRSALVLGAGGAARAAVWALRRAGAAEVAVWNRTAARAEALAQELGARAVPAPVAAELIVNCTSVGLEDGGAAPPRGRGQPGARRVRGRPRLPARRHAPAGRGGPSGSHDGRRPRRCWSSRARPPSSCGPGARRRGR